MKNKTKKTYRFSGTPIMTGMVFMLLLVFQFTKFTNAFA